MVRGSAKGDDIGKIFVGGLAPETTEEDLQEYFKKYGTVTDSVVMRDASTNTKRSRGFGFVTFQDPAAVEQVLASKPHMLGGKTIDPKHAVPRGPGQTGQGPPPQMRSGGGDSNNKIFVGGLPQNITEDHLMNFFSTFGKVVGAQLINDKDSGKMRGFGFVTFASPDCVKKAAEIRFHQINGKTVEAKRSEDRGRGRGMHMNQRNPLATPIHGSGMPGGYGGPGQYGGAHYPQQGQGHPYGQQAPGMGRAYSNPGGYGGYGAPGQPSVGLGGAPGYSAAPPSAGNFYAGMPGAGMPASGYGETGYGRGAPPARDGGALPYGSAGVENGAGYATSYSTGVTPAAGIPPPGAPAGTPGYADYNQMPATSSALSAPGSIAPQRVEPTPGAPDYSTYSAYALGSYQQQDSQYGPARSSLDSSGGYPAYAAGGGTDYAAAGAGAGGAVGGAGFGDGGSFGRGGGNVSRGFHPYGR